MKVTKAEKTRLKLFCLGELVKGVKGFRLAIAYDSKRDFSIKLNDVADFMVKKMIKDFNGKEGGKIK